MDTAFSFVHNMTTIGAGFVSGALFTVCFWNCRGRLAVLLSRFTYWFLRSINPTERLFPASTAAATETLEDTLLKEEPVTEDRIKTLMAQGTETGAFEKVELELVQRIFKLGDLKAGALMTPRMQMSWLDLEDSLDYNLTMIAGSTHSRFPVAKGSMDNFIGIIYTRDILARSVDIAEVDLAELVRTPLFVPKSMTVYRVLEAFKQSGAHEAIVLDEYGGVAGIITLHDILEGIVGDLPLMHELVPPAIAERADGEYLVDGMVAIDEFQQFFNIQELPEENREGYHTLGGFILSFLGYIPVLGESFMWQGLRLEITGMDRARVDKVLVIKLPKTEHNGQ